MSERRTTVDIEVLTERNRVEGEYDFRELRYVVLDGQQYDVPQESVVVVETVPHGPQRVTLTLWASDVRYRSIGTSAGELP